MTITDYQIVSGRTQNDLEGNVKHALRGGWQPIGGVAQETEYFVHSSPNIRLLQAMVKWEPTKL